jgi:hypothetical protein
MSPPPAFSNGLVPDIRDYGTVLPLVLARGAERREFHHVPM